MVKNLLNITAVISIVTYLFWNDIDPKYENVIFFTGNAITIALLCLIIFILKSELFISFFLLCISISNLFDELFFDPTKLGLNEIVLALILPIIWSLKMKINARKSIDK